MSVDVPPELRDRVRFQGGALVFQARAGSLLQRALGRVQAASRSTVQPHTPIHVSRLGVSIGGLRRRWVPHQGEAVRLVGEPGGHVTLFINGSVDPLLQVLPHPPGSKPWTTAQILWLGRTIALLLGIPWWVEWDRTAWDRWNMDPVFRGRARLQLARKRSQEAFPRLYGFVPEEPPGSVELDRQTYRVRTGALSPYWIHLRQQELQTERWTLAWESLHGVAAVFERGMGGPRPTGVLRACFFERQLDLLVVPSVVELEAVYLRWLEEALRARARRYVRPDGGTTDDIPEPLRNLRPGDKGTS